MDKGELPRWLPSSVVREQGPNGVHEMKTGTFQRQMPNLYMENSSKFEVCSYIMIIEAESRMKAESREVLVTRADQAIQMFLFSTPDCFTQASKGNACHVFATPGKCPPKSQWHLGLHQCTLQDVVCWLPYWSPSYFSVKCHQVMTLRISLPTGLHEQDGNYVEVSRSHYSWLSFKLRPRQARLVKVHAEGEAGKNSPGRSWDRQQARIVRVQAEVGTGGKQEQSKSRQKSGQAVGENR